MQWFHRRSTKCGRGRRRRRRTNSARISHPPPFRRVTNKNGTMCRTVYGDMHLKDLLGSNASVLYPGTGFLSSATWPLMPKKHYNGLINNQNILHLCLLN